MPNHIALIWHRWTWRLRRLLGFSRQRPDRTVIYGIHGQDAEGNFIHFLVARKPLPNSSHRAD